MEKIRNKKKIKFPSDIILKVWFGDLVVKNQIVEKEKIMHVIGYSTVWSCILTIVPFKCEWVINLGHNSERFSSCCI